MKQFIVMLAVLPLMLLFLVQFSVNQLTYGKIAAVDEAVYAAKEMAKQEGCFTKEIKSWLRDELSDMLGISGSKIVIKTSGGAPKERLSGQYGRVSDSLIYYEVSVPLGKTAAGSRLLGIRNAQENSTYCVKGYATSEYLP